MNVSKKALALILLIIAISTRVLSFSQQEVIQNRLENITEAPRSSTLPTSDYWATEPERQMFIPQFMEYKKLVRKGHFSQDIAKTSPEVVYIGDIFSTSRHRA